RCLRAEGQRRKRRFAGRFQDHRLLLPRRAARGQARDDSLMLDSRSIRHFDYLLLLLAVALVGYGCVLIYSASANAHPEGIGLGHPLLKQVIFAILGLGVMAIVAWLDYRIFGQMAVGLYVVAILMLAAVMVVGNSAYGSTRWFSFAGQQ